MHKSMVATQYLARRGVKSPDLAPGEVHPRGQPHQWQHGQACVGTHQQHHGHKELLGGLKQVARAPKIMCLSKR